MRKINENIKNDFVQVPGGLIFGSCYKMPLQSTFIHKNNPKIGKIECQKPRHETQYVQRRSRQMIVSNSKQY